ncbi:MAG: hypothetical protein WBG29_04485, partial [Candidatus Acidiferrales bacterium]
FLSSIASYLKLWGSLRASGVAVNLGGTWFNIAIRLEFIEGPPARTEIRSPETHFLYYVFDFPISARENLLREVVLAGQFELKISNGDSGAHAQILMKREAEHARGVPRIPVQWSSPLIREAGLPGDRQRKRTSITLLGYGQNVTELLSYEVARKIETRLRSATPCYDGLTGLFAHIVPGMSYTGGGNTLLEIVAELPFELRKGERDSICVEGPSEVPSGSLSLRCFYGPGLGLPPSVAELEPADAARLANGRLRWIHRPDWPGKSETARIVMFFEGEQVQVLEVNRWPSAGNIRQLVDSYFDPSQERLKSALLNRGAMNQQEFEWAVARLLNLLGLPAIWYGKGMTEAKPDLAGYIEGGPVLLVECTLEKPLEKFSGLAERAKQLQEQIDSEAVVLGLVFTRAQTVDSEKQHAHEHSLVVVGQGEIQELLKMLDSGSGTKETLAYIQELQSNLILELGTSLEW